MTRLLAVLFATLALAQGPPRMLTLTGDTSPVHDPVIMKDGDTYYVFCTGGGKEGTIPIRASKDLYQWTLVGNVFKQLPAWATKEIPKARGAWAPDISFFNGKYHLYYAVSSFGSRDSAIGLATNLTLNPADPKYQWADEGMVFRSYADKDDWNAIDANLVIEDANNMWLNWGSFWGGIKMRRIDPKTGKFSATDTTMHSIASRYREQPVGGSIEGPFIVRHGGYWYLFASFDRCCRGAQSTYNVVVGRSKSVTGPYVDKNGVPMTKGGGSLVIEATTRNWRGPGHNAILQEPGQDYLVFHAYDGTNGRSHLHISTMVWEDGWPRVAALP